MIKVKHIGTFFGPNPFSAKKAIVFEIQNTDSFLEDHYISRTRELKDLLPSDFEDFDCTGRHGAVKYVAKFLLEFLNYMRGDLRFSEVKYLSGRPIIVTDFHNQQVNIQVLKRLCAWLFAKNLNGDACKREITELWNLCKKYHPDFQAHALIEGAKLTGCSYLNLDGKYWVYGLGKGSKTFFETSLVSDLKGPRFSKSFCKSIFTEVGAPTAPFAYIQSSEDEERVAKEIGYKCVAKPLNGGSGIGITANISNFEEFGLAVEKARLQSAEDEPVLVEKHFEGFDYRLLFTNGKFQGCIKRDAPFVIGDGNSAIKILISLGNRNTSGSLYKSDYQRPIKIDDKLKSHLATQKLNLSCVLPAGKKVYLLSVNNLSGGGNASLVSNVHPKVLSFAEAVAKKLDVYSVGIDYISTDISEDPDKLQGVFTEFNRTPGVAGFIASGCAPSDIGKRFLGDNCFNIDICVYIVPDHKLRETLHIAELEHALIAPNYIVKNGKPHKVPGKIFLTVLAKYARDISLKKMNVILPESHVLKHGLIENITSVCVDTDIGLSALNFLKLSNISYLPLNHSD
jgi:cyanophycin synthetase